MNDHITLDVDRGSRIAIQVGRFAGRAVGLLIFATLAVLEPFVRFILMTLASLGIFVTIVFGFLIGAEGFPKWFMLGFSVGCFLLLGAYYGVMSIFGSISDTRCRR
jgi:hypothetical protein